MSRYVQLDTMRDLIGRAANLDRACEDLIQAAKSGGSDDNITCLLIKAVERPWHRRLFRRLTAGRRDGPNEIRPNEASLHKAPQSVVNVQPATRNAGPTNLRYERD